MSIKNYAKRLSDRLAVARDQGVSPKRTEELAGALPDAQLHLLEAGHMTFWEAPEAWGHAVRRWLETRELT